MNLGGPLTRELVAFRFYLQALLGRSSSDGVREVGGVTNHGLLVRRIEHWRQSRQPDDPVLWVTFNYDTILDQALGSQYDMPSGGGPPRIEECVSQPEFKLIKLHGSVSWGNVTRTPKPWYGPAGGYGVDPQIHLQQAKSALLTAASDGSLQIDAADIRNMPTNGASAGEWTIDLSDQDSRLLLPAIAVPLQSKADYVCPDDHVETLRELLPNVDRVLTIGWKAGEPDFVRDLGSIQEGASLLPVNGKPESREVVAANIRSERPDIRVDPDVGGVVKDAFSAFVENPTRLYEFLA